MMYLKKEAKRSKKKQRHEQQFFAQGLEMTPIASSTVKGMEAELRRAQR